VPGIGDPTSDDETPHLHGKNLSAQLQGDTARGSDSPGIWASITSPIIAAFRDPRRQREAAFQMGYACASPPELYSTACCQCGAIGVICRDRERYSATSMFQHPRAVEAKSPMDRERKKPLIVTSIALRLPN
jgi:hypothetical protein